MHLPLDRGGVALHLFAAQRRVVQHLLAPFGICVEHHALPENGRHERVRLGLVQIVVRGAEEELVGLGARQQDNLSAGQVEPADVTAFVAHALHQRDRVGAELFEMAVFVIPARDAGDGDGLLAHHSGDSGILSCWRSFGADFNGASGWSSIETTLPPRGVSATNATALAMSEARRKKLCRA